MPLQDGTASVKASSAGDRAGHPPQAARRVDVGVRNIGVATSSARESPARESRVIYEAKSHERIAALLLERDSCVDSSLDSPAFSIDWTLAPPATADTRVFTRADLDDSDDSDSIGIPPVTKVSPDEFEGSFGHCASYYCFLFSLTD